MKTPLPPQTAHEARLLVLRVMADMRLGLLDEARMQQLAPVARQAVRAKGLPPWERDFMDALASLLESTNPDQIAASIAEFEAAMDGVE